MIIVVDIANTCVTALNNKSLQSESAVKPSAKLSAKSSTPFYNDVTIFLWDVSTSNWIPVHVTEKSSDNREALLIVEDFLFNEHFTCFRKATSSLREDLAFVKSHAIELTGNNGKW